jgi:hypothetical protein
VKRMLFAWLGVFTIALSEAQVGLADTNLKPNPNISVLTLSARAPELVAVSSDEMTKQASEFIRRLLGPLNLPAKLTVQLMECGSPELEYDKKSSTATICYESLKIVDESLIKAVEAERLDQQTAERARKAAYIMVALRAVTPAIFDLLKVPVWGHPSDAADRLAAFMMLQFGEEFARNSIEGSIIYLGSASPDCGGAKSDGTESLECERIFNYLCIAYGGEPRTFQPLWNSLIETRRRDPDAVKRLAFRRGACLGLRFPQDLTLDTKLFQNCITKALNYQRDSTVAALQLDLWKCTNPARPPIVNTSEYEQVQQAFNLRIMPYVDPDAWAQLRGRRSLITKPSN